MNAERTITLHIGGVEASAEPVMLQTVLGSCIAVCLFDREAGIGGMNHFMLPSSQQSGGDPARFGVHAMDLLIGKIQRLGGQRHRLRAKLFGAGHVLRMAEHRDSVARLNIRFIERFIVDEKLTVLSRDLGGYQARQVRFYPHSGRALVRRIGGQSAPVVQAEARVKSAATAPPVEYGEITLFGDGDGL
jgi:chemotaxis receptor (MCP) glutamine deamidase CheD